MFGRLQQKRQVAAASAAGPEKPKVSFQRFRRRRGQALQERCPTQGGRNALSSYKSASKGKITSIFVYSGRQFRNRPPARPDLGLM